MWSSGPFDRFYTIYDLIDMNNLLCHVETLYRIINDYDSIVSHKWTT